MVGGVNRRKDDRVYMNSTNKTVSLSPNIKILSSYMIVWSLHAG
jgi:hypothetical protein